MKVPAHLQVGVCTHTGWVRTNNEDDFLLGSLPAPGAFFVGIADGMGGLAGGAEASRTALRAAASCVLDAGKGQALAQRVEAGFVAAGRRVYEASQAVPALRDMGTTLTLLCLADDVAVVGHVGDTRLYRVRGGRCEQLTEDHAVREPDNLLTRCIGAGQAVVAADHAVHGTAPGDRFVLVSDGVWSVLPEAVLAKLVGKDAPQAVAEALVAAALAQGGPDNATALVVDLRTPAAGAGTAAAAVECDLPREERPEDRLLWPRAKSLRTPFWPWLLWLGGAVLVAHAVLRWCGVERGVVAPFVG